ncbi:MAG TPA: HAMP domain-containing sensor histidine kinase, partial [Gemmatimonadaceae bacterium]|nr:HAMP domain-containing sensor histidine kinase [Gemmatimonadaceae bacterium]
TLSLERVRSATERREAAETIVQEARRLMHMVDNVLHFARAERGGNRVIARAMPLAPVVRAVLTTFAPLAEGSGVRLRAALDEALAARVDAAALRQILLNLLDNAVKYGPAGQTVTVGSARLDGYVRLWVEDEGAGIPVPDRERIWHPFVRIARDQHAARAGSGIGLAVVRELVELHGGRAWVESGVGGGARFVVEVGEDSESVAELESQPASESGSEPVSGERREGTGEEAHEPARGATRGPPPDITMVPDAPHAGIEAVPAGAIRRRVPPGGGR